MLCYTVVNYLPISKLYQINYLDIERTVLSAIDYS